MQFVVSTIYYLAIALIATGFAWLAYGKRHMFNKFSMIFSKNLSFICFFISGLTIALPLIFTDNGIDRETYIRLFQNVTWEQVLDVRHQEPGFMLINLILKTCFGTNRYITLIFFYSLMTFNVYFVIYKMRDKISVPLAVFIFSTIYTIQSINLMRIAAAGSLLLVASYELYCGKRGKSFLFFIIASLIHYSSILYLLVFLLLLVYNFFADDHKVKTFILIFILCLLFIAIIVIIPYIKTWPIISKYEIYLQSIQFEKLGFMQPMLYIPLVIISMYYYSCYSDVEEQKIFIITILPSFFYGMLGYMIPVIGRCYYCFIWPFVIGLPYMYNFKKELTTHYYNHDCKFTYNSLLNHQLINMFLITYIIFRFILYMSEYIELDGIGIL